MKVRLICGIIILMGLCGCGTASGQYKLKNTEPITFLSETKEVQKTPPATVSYREEDEFAYNINAQFNQNENYVFSPYSLKSALAMLANGAGGTNREEILKALGYNSVEELNDRMRALNSIYNQEAELKLTSANSIWVNKEMPELLKDFTNSLKANYNADSERVTAAEAGPAIKKWVEDKSNGMQKDFAVEVEDDFALVLVNTTYLKSEWAKEFEKENTRKAEFNNSDGTISNIDFMNNKDSYSAYQDDKTSIIRLDYKDSTENRDLAFYAVMTEDNINVEEYLNKLSSQEVMLSIPKFKGKFNVELNQMLKNFGIKEMFDPKNADFTNMTEEENNFYVSRVIQDTVFDVDEKGTEAASTTAVVMENCVESVEDYITMTFDKPFTYIIRDNTSGEILFMGRFAKG